MKVKQIIVDYVPSKCTRCLFFDPAYGDCVALDINIYDLFSFDLPDYSKPVTCPLVKEAE